MTSPDPALPHGATGSPSPRVVRVGLSMMLGDAFRRAVYPLFEAGVVDSLEWTCELGFGATPLPAYVEGLLEAYGAEGALAFHCVSASPLAPPPPGFEAWLEALRALATRTRPCRVSDHFGFVHAPGFRRNAPLPVPRTGRVVANARERLARLSDACGAPAGLENLAFAFSARDVLDEGAFLEEILAPVDGFLVLDLHNLHCRAVNFGLDPRALLERYPLARVRELHLSGGSESPVALAYGGGSVRRDTHDAAVPEEVFALLGEALALCPHVEDVVLERLPSAFATEDEGADFRAEHARTRAMVARAHEEAAR